jgi:hypothetical protein
MPPKKGNTKKRRRHGAIRQDAPALTGLGQKNKAPEAVPL